MFGRGHRNPHFNCEVNGPLSPDDCDGLNEPGVGHVCMCSCRRCSVVIRDSLGRRTEICVCAQCDAATCGLHRS